MKQKEGIYVSPRCSTASWVNGNVAKQKIIEDQFDGWLFRPARQLCRYIHSQMAAFQLQLSFFEAYEQLVQAQTSQNNAGAFFRARFSNFATWLDGKSGEMYQAHAPRDTSGSLPTGAVFWVAARNGLFHSARLKSGVVVNPYADEVGGAVCWNASATAWEVCPKLLGEAIERYFAECWTAHRANAAAAAATDAYFESTYLKTATKYSTVVGPISGSN